MGEPQLEFAEVYAALRALAARRLGDRATSHTLQPTALVNEAYLKLANGAVDAADRSHYFAIAAKAMRQVLIDHARRKGALRRGNAPERVNLETGADGLIELADEPLDLIIVHDLLTQLEEHHPVQAKIVELRLFAGASVPEVATALDTSVRSVERHWRFARAWLKTRLASS